MKFRKKPIVIEAVQWTGSQESIAALQAFAGHWISFGSAYPVVTTLEGGVRINKDDWIIRGIKGEFYPCRADIFEATYEEVK